MIPAFRPASRVLTAVGSFLFAAALFAADPAGVAEYNRRGVQHLEKGEFAQALTQFQAAAKLRPADPAVQFNVGLALFRLGRYREALGPLEKSIPHAASARQARYLRGIILFEQRAFDSCTRELETLRSDPDLGEHVLYMLEESYRNALDAKRSREAFVELASRYPDSAYLHKLMGMAHEWQNHDSKAIAEFSEALRRNPRMREVAFAIGYIYFKQQNFEAAREWLAKELALDPCYAKAHHFIGEMDFAGEQWDAAGTRYRKAIACDPAFGDPYIGLGSVLEQKGTIEAALKMYREAVRLNPRDSRAHFKLGLALRRTGRAEQADSEFAIAKRIIQEEESKKSPDPAARPPD